MDANNTKYHLLYGERDWLPVLFEQDSIDIWWDREKHAISLAPIVEQLSVEQLSAEELSEDSFSNLAPTTALSTERRRGAAFDHYGNIYWINAAENEIIYHPSATPLALGSFWHVDLLQAPCSVDVHHGDFYTAETES
ncbi:MAG: hypothetical protein ACI9Y1_000094, partial [Lentisphaeria bacterium]